MKNLSDFLILICLTTITAHAQQIETNRKIVRLYFEEVVNQKRFERLNEVFAESYATHSLLDSANVTQQTVVGQTKFLKYLTKALPDIHYTIRHIVAEGDKVVVSASLTATHKDELLGFPATGNRIPYLNEIFIFRFQDGKVVESWFQLDLHNLTKYLSGQK